MTALPSTDRAVRPRTAVALLAAVILIWGANWPIMKIGVAHIGPMTFLAARMALAVLCMLPLLHALGRLHWPTRRDWPIVLSIGLLQMAAFNGLTVWALQVVEAGRSAILAYTTPLWVVPGAALLLGERIGRLKAVGLAAGLAGVAVMFNPAALDWGDHDQLVGNGLLMLAAAVWAVPILQIRGHRWDSAPLDLAIWQYLVAALAALPLMLWLESDLARTWDAASFAVLAYNGPIATAFGFFAVVTINRSLPATTTSLAMLGVPAAGLVFSAAMIAEPIGPAKLAGLALIGLGLALVSLADRRRAS
ncbi:MAG: DMT family transporter [Azospirillaceae bacterium]